MLDAYGINSYIVGCKSTKNPTQTRGNTELIVT